jgi:hypothetical protein
MGGTDPAVDPPVWPTRQGEARALVEAAEEAERHWLEEALVAAGYEVLCCAGPRPEAGAPCPAVDGDRCPGAAHADVVVCSFDDTDEHRRSIPGAVAHELREGASVVALVDPDAAGPCRDDLIDCRQLLRPVTTEAVLTAVADAVADLVDTPEPEPVHSRRQRWPRRS